MPHKLDVIVNANAEHVPEFAENMLTQSDTVLNVLACLGYDPMNPPAAELLKQLHHLEGKWVVLSPIHWEATHNDALIMASGKQLGLTDQQLQQYFEQYASYLAEEKLELVYHAPDVWLMRLTELPGPYSKPVHHVLQHSLMPELDQMDEHMVWQKLITESQMFFAAQETHTLLNGIWPWGAADGFEKKSMTICADEHFIDLAQICSHHVLPYSPSVELSSVSILLINELTSLSSAHQEELKKHSTTWYWNNLAYTQSQLSWFARLWRTLTHAH